MSNAIFKEIYYSNSIKTRTFEDLFIFNDEYNQSIYKTYMSLQNQKSELGVTICSDMHVFGEWGMILDHNENILPNIANYGWFTEAYKYLAKNNSDYFRFESEIISLKNLFPRKITQSCAMLSFPGALTYGHWIVDVIIRYEFINKLRLSHKIEKFLLPESIGHWSRIFLDFLNIDESDIIRMSNETYLRIDNLYIPTVASFLPGTTLPIEIASKVFNEFRNYLISLPSNISPLTQDLVMLQHTPQTSGSERDIDLSDLENYIISIGGAIVDPLKYSLPELVSLLSNCKTIIGQDSSALHNNAFIGANLIVIESLTRQNMLHVSIQDAINKKLQFIKSHKVNEEYKLDLNEVERVLSNL